MPKTYYSTDAQEMFPYSRNCFIFIFFDHKECLTMTSIHFLLEKNQSREFSVECHRLLKIRLINYLISNHHILLLFHTLLKAQYKPGLEIKHPSVTS